MEAHTAGKKASKKTKLINTQKPIKQIATGWGHTCIITKDSKIKCWGENFYKRQNIPKEYQ